MRRFVIAAALVLAAGTVQAYPDRVVTIVHPYAPGAASDAFGRAMAEQFARRLGQSAVYTNRDGASGVVGMRHVAGSAPDGHVLGLSPMTAIVVQPHMLRNAGIGPESFDTVCGTNENILGIAVRADSPIKDLPGLIAEGRRRALTFGSAGPNSLPQLSQVGIYAPCGTLVPVLERLEAPCREALEQEQVKAVMAQTRVVPHFMPREELARMVREECATYGRLLRELGVEPE